MEAKNMKYSYCFSLTHDELFKVNPDDATSQLSQSELSDNVGKTCNTVKQRGAVYHGDTVPCFVEQSYIVWTDLNAPPPTLQVNLESRNINFVKMRLPCQC